jgi:hypothetical protein
MPRWKFPGVVGREYQCKQPGVLDVNVDALFEMPPTGFKAETYVWALRICDDEGTKLDVFLHTYQDKPITVTPGATLRPEFRQAVPLRPGRYRVQPDLHKLTHTASGEPAAGELEKPTTYHAEVK